MKTEILVITDRSGSMSSIANDVIGGYNRFLQDQKAQPGEARLTYAQFDDRYEVVHAARPISEVSELDSRTFVPRGMTALFDAIGRTLNEQGERIAREKWAELVVVCIITDGQENASREYSKTRIQEMVKHAESNGWQFLFLAANQDAFGAAQSFGSAAKYAGNFQANAAGVAMAYGSTSATLSALRSGEKPDQLLMMVNTNNS
jgi:Mg-chelatase subunit ChlD